MSRAPGSRSGRVCFGIEVAAVVLLCCQRGYLAWTSPRPTIFADEAGTWAIARYLAQEQPLIDMFRSPPYSVVGGALLAPIVWAVDGDAAQFRWFLVVSTMCAVLAGLVASSLARIVFEADRPTRAVVFAVVVLFPAATTSGSFSWVEFLTPLWLLTLGWLLVSITLEAKPSTWIAAGALAGSSPAVHGRFQVVPVLFGGVALWTVWRWASARPRPAGGIAGPVLSLLALGAAFAVWSWLESRALSVWIEPDLEVRDAWRSKLGDAYFYRALVVYSIGHGWYALASTFGLAGVGVARLVGGIVRPGSDRDRERSALLLVVSGSVMAASVVFAASNAAVSSNLVGAPDFLYYGRYADPAILLWTVVGVATIGSLLRAGDARRAVSYIAGAAIGLAVVGAITAGAVRNEVRSVIFGPRVPGIWLLPFDSSPVPSVATVSVVGLAGALFLAAIARRQAQVIAAGLLVWSMLSVFGTRAVLDVQRRYPIAALHDTIPAVVSGREEVVVASDVAFDGGASLGVLAQQYFLVHDGWRFEVSALSSSELVANGVPRDVGLVVLRVDVDASGLDGFGQVLTYGLFQVLAPVDGEGT